MKPQIYPAGNSIVLPAAHFNYERRSDKITKYLLGLFIALIFASCSSSNREEEASMAADTTSTTAGTASDLPGTESKIVKTADIDFEVKDVYTSSSNISRNVRKFGGMVMQNNIQTSELGSKEIPFSDDSVQLISSYKIDARMTVEVPSAKLEEFLEIITTDATIIYTANLEVSDRSIDYLGSKLKQQSRQKILDKQLAKDTLKNEDVLQLANQQEAIIDQKMNNLRTDASVRYSSISLHFTQTPLLKKQILPNNDLRSYQPSVAKRLGDSFSSGLDIFIAIVVGISYTWPFLLLGLAGWFGYRFVSRRINMKAE